MASGTELDATDILLIIEGLDCLVPYEEGSVGWKGLSEDEHRRWTPYRLLRRRLQDHVGMRMHEGARTWLRNQFRKERAAALQEVQRVLWQALA